MLREQSSLRVPFSLKARIRSRLPTALRDGNQTKRHKKRAEMRPQEKGTLRPKSDRGNGKTASLKKARYCVELRESKAHARNRVTATGCAFQTHGAIYCQCFSHQCKSYMLNNNSQQNTLKSIQEQRRAKQNGLPLHTAFLFFVPHST